MSIRIRESGGLTVALCAVEADAAPGDVYLNDAQHYALAAKFADDWQGQMVEWRYSEEWAEMAKHKVRDAETELNTWLAASVDRSPEGGDHEDGRHAKHESAVGEAETPTLNLDPPNDP